MCVHIHALASPDPLCEHAFNILYFHFCQSPESKTWTQVHFQPQIISRHMNLTTPHPRAGGNGTAGTAVPVIEGEKNGIEGEKN